jgi:hypothetical protein
MEKAGGRKTRTFISVESSVARRPAPRPPRHALTITARRKSGETSGGTTGESRSVAADATPTAQTATT